MFGLIPMVITIILAGLITASVAYFGGDIFTDSSIHAKANTIINEGGQVRSAAQLYRTMNRKWPSAANGTGIVTDAVEELMSSKKYLSNRPQFTFSMDVGSDGVNGDGIVYAQGTSNTGDQAITVDICNKIEHTARGLSDGTDPSSLTLNATVATNGDALYGCINHATWGYSFYHR